jgi:PKD repeat protein
VVVAGAVAATVTAGPSLAALPDTSSPSLSLERTIRTVPFVGTNQSMRDSEGSAFVRNDPGHPNIGGTDSLWLVDDNSDSVWEVNPHTGALKTRITGFDATRQYDPLTGTGSGPAAGSTRDPDLESMAYDPVTDTLYAFSGNCCSSSVQPTAFRLKRGGDGTFHPESWQPLTSDSSYTASTWNPADGKLYVGYRSDLRTYDYPTNTSGATFRIPGVSGMLGLGFSDDGADLLVVTGSEDLFRVTWSTRTIRPGWTFDLTAFDIRDSRGVELIGDQVYVLDGYDGRSTSSPLKNAVFVFDVCCGPAAAPTASFSSAAAASPPLTVQFTDTSTGTPTGWAWNFGDGATSTTRNPVHTYAAPGNYPVTLTASNSAGSSQQTKTVTVTLPPAPTASFSWSAVASPPLTVQFTDTSTGSPSGWAWDFGDGTTATTKNPAHTYAQPGDYDVTLVASNATGDSQPVTRTVTVSPAPPPPSSLTVNPVADSYVSSESPTKNYGTATALKTKLSGTKEYRTFLTFSVSGLQGKAVSSARLRLFVSDSGGGGGVHTVASDWTESGSGGLTWNNQPSISAPVATAGSGVEGSWLEVDLTGVVSGEGTYRLAMTTDKSNTVYYDSREGGQPPQLVLTLQ